MTTTVVNGMEHNHETLCNKGAGPTKHAHVSSAVIMLMLIFGIAGVAGLQSVGAAPLIPNESVGAGGGQSDADAATVEEVLRDSGYVVSAGASTGTAGTGSHGSAGSSGEQSGFGAMSVEELLRDSGYSHTADSQTEFASADPRALQLLNVQRAY